MVWASGERKECFWTQVPNQPNDFKVPKRKFTSISLRRRENVDSRVKTALYLRVEGGRGGPSILVVNKEIRKAEEERDVRSKGRKVEEQKRKSAERTIRNPEKEKSVGRGRGENKL